MRCFSSDMAAELARWGRKSPNSVKERQESVGEAGWKERLCKSTALRRGKRSLAAPQNRRRRDSAGVFMSRWDASLSPVVVMDGWIYYCRQPGLGGRVEEGPGQCISRKAVAMLSRARVDGWDPKMETEL